MSSDLGRPLSETDRIDAFHELLLTLTGAVDVRETVQRLGAIVGRIFQYDEAHLILLGDDGLPASTSESDIIRRGDEDVLQESPVPRVILDARDRERGYQTGMQVPVLVDGRAIGASVFLSRRPEPYSERDLALATRVVDYIAVALSRQGLAEQARRTAIERDRASNLESSVALLRTISEVLDIRRVFPRISEIVSNVLPHDHLNLYFNDQAGHVVLEARSSETFPEVRRMTAASQPTRDDEFAIVGDLTKMSLPVTEPADFQDRVVAAGFRSVLGIQAFAREQGMFLSFWSKRTGAYGSSDVAVARRITDYITMAVSHEQLADAERRVAEARARAERLEARVKSLAEDLDLKSGLSRAIGQSAEWRDVLKKATQVAATETTVLLQGDSGTGKEVVARFIHRASPRKDGPFVAINCAALPEQLLESELFGYERGAFTGAMQPKPGQIELASGGVLFLDEVSEMSPSAQAKFLRVLQEREFQRLGGTRTLRANARVITATNRDLRKAVSRGAFREDLYYRLQVFEIRMPPLRERKSDLLPLADAFLQDISRSLGRPPAGLTEEAKGALLEHDWPGNVRELRNALERAAILCDGGLITTEHLSLYSTQPAMAQTMTDLRAIERQTIEQVMRETGWNKAKAAKRLGLTRIQLYGRLRKYEIEKEAPR